MQGIIFDLDGTLIDSAPTILRSLQESCASVGIDTSKCNFVSTLIGPPIAQIVQKLIPGIEDEKCQAVAKAFRTIYDNCGHKDTLLYPGIDEMLKKLKEQGKRLFVCTNKPSMPTDVILTNLKIKEYFEDVVTVNSKPDIKLTKSQMIEEVLNQNAGDFVMVGDCVSDIDAAHKNSIKGIAASYGYEQNKEELLKKADETFDSVESLKCYLCEEKNDKINGLYCKKTERSL